MTTEQKDRTIRELCRAVDQTMERLEIDQHQSYVSQKGIRADLEELRYQLSQLQDKLGDNGSGVVDAPATVETLSDRVLRMDHESGAV